ncbi:hypothetical protein PUN28_009075 [Cardiocondyla obscurior]|uniref:Uncharacterized protein n=1 Tax=Cardiocondyla obscurior TaxID=286306 RepID=A0AAW2FVU9_9HYME
MIPFLLAKKKTTPKHSCLIYDTLDKKILQWYHTKILKTRRRYDLRSCRARKDEAIVSKHHGSSDSIFFSPSSRTGNSDRSCYELSISSLFELSIHQRR